MTEIQTLLKALRSKYGLSYEKLAVKLGMSYFTIRAWDEGTRKPGHFVIEKVQQILRGYESANR